MRFSTIFLIASFAAGPLFADSHSLSDSFNGLGNLFDRSARSQQGPVFRMPQIQQLKPHRMPLAPAPADPDQRGWGSAPGIPSIKSFETWIPGHDVFNAHSECHIIDVVYVRQPSLAEVISVLIPCARAISKSYGVPVRLIQGKGEVTISLGSILPPNSTLGIDLNHSLRLREREIFGYPARILQPQRDNAGTGRTSSLQLVLDRCPMIALVREIRSTSSFIGIYGNCLRRAEGLNITEVKPDPLDAGAILIYSGDLSHTIANMRGTISVPSSDGRYSVRIKANREAFGDNLLDTIRWTQAN